MRWLIVLISILNTSPIFAAQPVQAIDNFAPQKYVGSWYEVARLPMSFENKCKPPITAHYELDPNDSNRILVKNSCHKIDGGTHVATAVATFAKTANIAELKVNFLPAFLRWVPFTTADYWVLYTDYTHAALVGLPNHKYLWILSRTPQLDQPTLNKLIGIAKAQGFATEQLVFN